MAGISVGSVSVTVVPDASNFVPRLRQDTTGVSAVGDDIGRTMGDKIASRIGSSIVDGVSSGASKATASAAGGGDSAGGAFADAFKKRVEAALAALPDAKIGADATDADRKLAELRAQLEELSGKTVGVDLSDEDAKAKLDSLKASLDELGHKSESVSIKVDTAAASAELAKFRAELDTATAGDGGSAGGGIFAAIQSGANGASGAVTPMVAAISMLAPALVPIGAAAAAGLGGIATMALAGAAGVGVLYLGLSDVVKAVSAVSAAHQSAAVDAATSAQAQLAAANQVKSAEASLANARASAADTAERSAQTVKAAEQGVADAVRKAAQDQITAQENLANAAAAVAQARVSSAQQVATAEQALDTAEQSLTNAVYTETQAQQALVTARQAAQRQLESYQQQIADGALTQRQDLLNVQTTKQALDATLANPAATLLQREQAQLTYDQAVQALADQQRNYDILKQDAAAAAKAGVDGAANVVAAQHQVVTATQGVQTAQQGVANATAALATAQTNAARAVATALQHQGDVERQVAQQQIADQEAIQKARTAVSNAVEAQATAQRQAAFSVAQAQQSVTVALEAQHHAATTLSSSQQAANSALSQLTPIGQGLVAFIAGTLMPAFNGLKGAAENGLLPGIQALLVDLMPALPALITFVGGLATTMGDLFAGIGKELTDPFWTNFFGWLAATAGPTLTTMAQVVGGFVEGLAGMIQAMSPLTTMIGNAFAGMATGFASFATNTKPGSPLEQFISYAKASLPVVGSTLEALGKAFGHIIVAAAPIGLVVLRMLSDLSNVIAAIPTPVLTVLVGLITASVPVILGVAAAVKLWAIGQAVLNAALDVNPIVLIGVAIVGLGVVIYELVTHWTEVWNDIKQVTSDAWSAITGFFSSGWDWVKNVFEKNWQLILGILTGPIGLAVGEIVTHWSDITGAFSAAWDWVSGFFAKNWELILGILGGPIGLAVEQIATHWSDITGAFSTAWTWVSKTFAALWGDTKTGVGAVITGPLQAVAATVTGIWGDIKSAFVAGVNDVIKVINDFIHGIDTIVGAIPGLPSKLIPDVPPISTGSAAPATGVLAAIGSGTKRFAEGGTVGAGFVTDGPRAIVGEGNPAHPEFVIPTDPVYRDRALALFTALGSHLMESGGIVPMLASGGSNGGGGWSLNPLTDLKKIGSDILSTVGDVARVALGPVRSAADAALGLLPPSFVRTMAEGVVNYIFGGVGKMGAGHGSSGGPAGPVSYSAGVQQWAPQVLQALGMLGQPADLVSHVLRRMNQESGGNPQAVNRWDSNWQKGIPSVGLMQVVGPTFGAYAGPFAGTGPFMYGTSIEPLANIYAGLNYALHDYPSLQYAMDKAGGYAAGGIIGRPFSYDEGGWLQPGYTPVWNGTGAPEPVMNPAQWEGMKNGNGDLLAELRTIKSLLATNPQDTAEGVAAGMDGVLQRASIAHADRSLLNERTR